MGLDYVFVYSGLMESKVKYNPAEALDMLIIPVFVVPSRKINVESNASGSYTEEASAATGPRIAVGSAPHTQESTLPLEQGSDRDDVLTRLQKQLPSTAKLKDPNS